MNMVYVPLKRFWPYENLYLHLPSAKLYVRLVDVMWGNFRFKLTGMQYAFPKLKSIWVFKHLPDCLFHSKSTFQSGLKHSFGEHNWVSRKLFSNNSFFYWRDVLAHLNSGVHGSEVSYKSEQLFAYGVQFGQLFRTLPTIVKSFQF